MFKPRMPRRAIAFPDDLFLKVISPRTELTKLPDINILLGSAEDKLLFLLDINRSKGLEEFYKEFRLKKPDLEVEFPDTIIDALRASLSERSRIYSVCMKNGQLEELFVSQKNLSELFESFAYVSILMNEQI